MNDAASFGQAFKGFMDSMRTATPTVEPVFLARLRTHLGADPRSLPAVTHEFPKYDHPNLQLAIDSVIADCNRAAGTAELLGISSAHKQYGSMDICTLLADNEHAAIRQGPPEYSTFLKADGSAISCLTSGLLLISGPVPIAALVTGPSPHAIERVISVEVMSPSRADSEAFLQLLRSRAAACNVYRGHSLVIHSSYRGVSVNFHPLPTIGRDDIILDEATLARIERQTISFASVADQLRAAGRHLKRGILLHGPPGTGKTLSAMYLASRMTGRTVVLTAGLGHGAIGHVCDFARALQPATVVLEDVDLIAEDRESQAQCSMPLLFELLNQMDGLNEDADVLFILTTNRPQALEAALSSRPGRIDQAIEVPLPDANCRRRLIDLYACGLTLSANVEPFIDRTAGASASFIRELLRRAALLAILDGQGSAVEDKHLDESLRELTLSGALTGRLLGFERGHGPGATPVQDMR